MKSQHFAILILVISAFKFSQSATAYCAQPENEGRLKWHATNCNRYYRCWNGNALELACPFVAPQFDSCRLVCISDANAICGDPAGRCPVIPTTTTTTTTTTTEATTTVQDVETTSTIPTPPTVRLTIMGNF